MPVGKGQIGLGEVNPSTCGLTKLEQACIALGIPETGDPELDALILKSERKRISAMAMQALASAHDSDGVWSHSEGDVAFHAVRYADELLEELVK